MKLKKTWAALLLLLCLGFLGKSGLLASDKVPVKIVIKGGHGWVEIWNSKEDGKTPNHKEVLVKVMNANDVDETEKTYDIPCDERFYFLAPRPHYEATPRQDLYKVESITTIDGQEVRKVEVLKERPSDGYYQLALGFKKDTKVTQVVYEVTFTDRININFKAPDAADGVLEISYQNKQTQSTKKLESSGGIPTGTEMLHLSLTSKKLDKIPEVTYTSQVGQKKYVELKSEGNKYVGKIPLDGILDLNIDIRYVSNEAQVNIVTPPASRGTLKVSYTENGAQKELTASGPIRRGTLLKIEATKADASSTCAVYVLRDGASEKSKIELTTTDQKTYKGEVYVDAASLKITVSFTADGSDIDNAVEDSRLAGITVGPNPVGDRLYIQNIAQEGVIYALIDANGNLIQTSVLNAGFTTLDASSLPRGLYLLRLTTPEGGQSVRKILVDR